MSSPNPKPKPRKSTKSRSNSSSSADSNSSERKIKKALKIVFIGDGAVGKTSLIYSYAKNEFPETYTPTVFDNVQTDAMYEDKKTREKHVVRLDIHDTAGQEDYARVRKLTYPETDCFCLVFDVTEEASLENVHSWIVEIENYVPEDQRRIILVGNKIDKVDARTISVEQARAKAHHNKCKGYVECSAKTREGVDQVFDYAVNCIMDDSYLLPYQQDYVRSNKKKDKKDCVVM